MSNKIILKKSSVGAKVPQTGDLDYGELALNYADGKLYFKNSSNAISSFSANIDLSGYASLTGTQTLTNKTVSSPVITGTITANGGVGTSGQILSSTGTGVQWITTSAGSSGTVTSIVAGTGLSGGTITTTGTIALASGYGDTLNPYASKTANYVLAAPNGTAGVPTFRALVSADIPTLNQNTTGSAATLTTPRAINGVNFDGSAAITITAANPNALTIGAGLSGTLFDGSSAVTVAIDSTVATLTGTQTLINKTLTSPTLNSATENNLTITGTLNAGGGVGTNGQVLQSTGSGVQWASGGTTLPSQTGQVGKYLSTDGTNLSWALVNGSSGFPYVDAGFITDQINTSALVDGGTII
jgi:hypothetical protein